MERFITLDVTLVVALGRKLSRKLDIPLVGGHILIRYNRVRKNDGLDCPDTLLCEQWKEVVILGLVLKYDVNVVLEYESHLGGKARELDWLVLWKVHYIVGGAGSGPGKELDIPIVGGAGSGPGKELDKKLDIPLVGGTHPDQI